MTAALLTALAPPAAWSDGGSARDRNDARGPLDIARVSHAHRGSAGSATLVHTMRLRSAWPVKKLRGNAFALFYFDLRGRRGAGAERTVQVQYENGRLVAHMFDQVNSGQHVGAVTLRRPDRRTIRVSFPKSMLRKGLRSYKWNAATLVETPRGTCRSPGCIDWAPHGRKGLRYVKHAL
ncbi:MAG: hypothetical protein M3279_08220 [Actinomycetota bacterium]|nr:hypothetical protein [Actinomycetota bacterium]